MSKAFLIDVSRCSGCYNCQLACKDEHCGNDWSPIAKPQPEIGQFWVKLNEYIQGTVPKVKMHYITKMCGHCENASCMAACDCGAMYRREDGLIIIDPDKCNGCKKCMEACPYDAIYFNEEYNIAQKCTGCAHLLDNGAAVPRCVDACPTGALKFGEESELDIEGAEVLMPETANKSKAYYRNIPGKFIAGMVYDPDSEDIIEGAKCHLTTGGKYWDVYTDDFGDFWFKDLPVGKFTLAITANGYESKLFENISTSDSVNLGEIALREKK